MLEQNSSIPLYEQLKQAIKSEIQAGAYKPGCRMPSEAELEQIYQVSRITVRRAIKELCQEEILVRKQGKGTFVLENPVYKHIDRTIGSFHDSMAKEGKKVTVDILEKSIIRVRASYASDLAIAPDDEVVYLKRLMYADGIPVMIDTNYIPLKRFPGIYDRLEGNLALFSLLEKEYGVKLERYYKVLKVQKATREMGRLLDCRAGDPMFDLFKITYNDEGVPQTISISILKGEDTFYVISNGDVEGDEVNQSGLSWKM